MSAYSASTHGLAMRKIPQGVLDTVNQLLFDAGQVGGNLSFTDFSKIWQDSAGTTPYTAVEQFVGKIIDKSPNALAFTQATSAARPVVSARVNLFAASETFSDASWTKSGSFISNNATLAPNGTLTADKLTADTSLGGHNASYGMALIAGNALLMTIRVKIAEVRYVTLRFFSGGAWASNYIVYFDLLLGTVKSTSGAGVTASISSIENGFVKIGLQRTTDSTGFGIFGVLLSADGVTTSYLGNNSDGLFVWGADIRPASQSNLPYQRVNTPTDYDTAGFPHSLKFDGIDDNLVSAAGGGGAAGIYFCGAIQFNKVGAVQTIFSDAGTNSGYKLRLTAANQLEISAGNGTAYTAINTTDTFAVGDVALCEFWDDGTNLGVRLGEGTPVTVARPVVTAGTAQITIGKDNNAASNYAGIGMFEPVWRYGAMPNPTQREAIRAICRSKAGIV